MIVVGLLIIGFGVAVIVLRKGVRNGIESKAKKIDSPMISKSVKSDGTRRVVETGFAFIVIGIFVVLNGVGVL